MVSIKDIKKGAYKTNIMGAKKFYKRGFKLKRYTKDQEKYQLSKKFPNKRCIVIVEHMITPF